MRDNEDDYFDLTHLNGVVAGASDAIRQSTRPNLALHNGNR